MANRLIMKNSTVAGKRPATGSGSPGEIFVNIADRVIGSFDASGNPIELGPVGATPAVAPFDATHSYSINDLVANAGKIYRAKVAGVNAWNAANWEDININPAQPVAYYDQTATYSANDLVAINGKIYSSIAGSVAGVFDATKWTELGATYTLPIATAAAIGGVKANAGTAGQYVTGIDATGALTYATPPDISGIMPFDATKTYPTIGTLVSNTGKIYRSTVAITTAAAWNPAQWADIAATVATGVEAFDAGKTYALNNIVSTGGKIYRANGPIAAAAFNATQWTEISVNAFTAGSIPFADTGGALTEDNAALNFNKTRKQLGIGVIPTATDPLLTVNSDAKINGMTVGKGGGSLADNIAFGRGALAANTTGDQNVAIGASALGKNNALGNVAIGSLSARFNVSGVRNISIGTGSLAGNVSGSSNVSIGAGSQNNSDASFNTCIGDEALNQNIAGANNTAIGFQALNVNMASNNTAIGYRAGKSITTGSGNVVIGSAPGEAAMTNTVIIADGAGGEKVRWTDTGAMQIGQTAEPTGIAGKLHLWFNGTNLMMKVGTGAAQIVK